MNLLLITGYCQLVTVNSEGRFLSDGQKTVGVNVTAAGEDTSFSEVESVKTPVVRIPESERKSMNVVFPLKNIKATSFFGSRYHPVFKEMKFHSGIDLRAFYEGVYSFSSGVVERASYDQFSGYCVVLNHGGSIKTMYAHLSYIGVIPGQVLSAGGLLGVSGNTGVSTAPHLHFAIKYKNAPVDPWSVFKFVSLKH